MVNSTGIVVEELTPPAASPRALQHARFGAALSSLSVVALGLTIAIFAGYFVIYLVYARALFAFPFDYDQGEGFELYDAIRLARGEGIYLDNAEFPFYASNYPPVYRLVLAPLVAWFGPHLWVGRALAFAASLVTGALIFLAARRLWQAEGLAGDERQSRRALRASLFPILRLCVPLLAALAFFAANYVYQVGPLARAHVPMVMFAFAGISCLDIGLDPRRASPEAARARYSALGVVLLLIAGWTKLQAVDALVAGFTYLLIRRPKWFALALAASALVTGALVLAMNAATNGQFWLNVVLANVNAYDIAVTWQTYGQWFRLQGVLIVCSVLYVAWDVARAARARSFGPITIWSLYFVAGSAMGMLTGKWGAGPAYLIAAIAASCVCAAGLLVRITHRWARRLRDEAQGARDAARSTSDATSDASGAERRAPYLPALATALAALIFFLQAALNVHLPTSGRIFGAIARLIGVADTSSYPPYPYYDSAGFTQLGHLLDPADAANGWAMVEMIRSVPGPVWSEEAMLTLLAGKDVVTNPTQLLNLSKNGMLDTSRMIAMIEQRAFGAVVFRALFYPDEVKEAIFRNYYWARHFRMNGFDYWVLLPAEQRANGDPQ
ncbi:MAG: hypothetical protein D6709_00900 [Chloroflexi bacterium]|uniref:Glycosyltransferase RgtA/B/C/D-like domain-containing protein n=1 Tax=Candidatus Thermofonsia Clade 3 bacterium TaxID=2364212 RepID=A0A2M8QF93_9CHLR|nr:hypothetical protein [Candidatus Roseilinea sp. NK_OTU-006]PJF48477.1 MAG: hypothetical protein CUN48_03180 [Candidatus Thermofonsia Clade 3 bacterium]RMG66107.1 MAG: hypothetical protein D6709_00900 [Chloroflexota bacterium]